MSAVRIVVLLLTASLAGCGSLTPPPTDTFYRLNLTSPPVTAGAPVLAGVVAVAPFTASSLHSQRALVYAHANGTSLEQHAYHFWIDSPRLLMQHGLADFARTQGLAEIVVIKPAREAAYEIQGRIERLERVGTGKSHNAEVALALEIYRARSTIPEFTRSYNRSVFVAGDSIAECVNVIGEQTVDIFAAFAQDLRDHFASR